MELYESKIIAVGTEIHGSDCQYQCPILSEKLASLGIDVYFQTTVGTMKIVSSLFGNCPKRNVSSYSNRRLGTNRDSLTKQTLAKFLGALN